MAGKARQPVDLAAERQDQKTAKADDRLLTVRQIAELSQGGADVGLGNRHQKQIPRKGWQRGQYAGLDLFHCFPPCRTLAAGAWVVREASQTGSVAQI